jgi:hypothetical protein
MPSLHDEHNTNTHSTPTFAHSCSIWITANQIVMKFSINITLLEANP